MNKRNISINGFAHFFVSSAILVSGCSQDSSSEAKVETNSQPGKVYQVGPGRDFKTISALLKKHDLVAGDRVEVDCATYSDKIIFTESGSEERPITIVGLSGEGCERPIIKANPDKTLSHLKNVVEFRESNHYVFENFEIDGDGVQVLRCVYHHNHDLTLSRLKVHNCPKHGVASSDESSGDLVIEYSEFYDCGGGQYDHCIYAESDPHRYPGSTFRLQHSYLHHPNGGNQVKSRSERNEIYYNWIEDEGAFKALELIGVADDLKAYHKPFHSDVAGNVFVKKRGSIGAWSIRVGHDTQDRQHGSEGRFRIVNNTFYFERPTSTAIWAYGELDSIEMHNNVFQAAPDVHLKMLDEDEAIWKGGRRVHGTSNWVKSGSSAIPSEWSDTIFGSDPGFIDAASYDFRLKSDSPCRDKGNPSPEALSGQDVPSPLWPLAAVPPQRILAKTSEPRVSDQTIDCGAFEYEADTK